MIIYFLKLSRRVNNLQTPSAKTQSKFLVVCWYEVDIWVLLFEYYAYFGDYFSCFMVIQNSSRGMQFLSQQHVSQEPNSFTQNLLA